MKKNILLYGAGGAGKELAFNLAKGSAWQPLGFVDDTKRQGEIINGLPVLGGSDCLEEYAAYPIAVCIVNDPKIKREIISKIKKINPGRIFPFIMNEQSISSESNTWGEGCIVAQPWNYITVNVRIGDFVWINTRADIGHDAVVGDYTTIFTRVSIGGDVQIGKDCVIGTGAIFRPGVKIGDNVTVGGGAVVVKDFPDDVVIAGNPAKVLKLKENKVG